MPGWCCGEPVVTVVEGLLIWAVVRRRPLGLLACALVANAASAVSRHGDLGVTVISWAS